MRNVAKRSMRCVCERLRRVSSSSVSVERFRRASPSSVFVERSRRAFSSSVFVERLRLRAPSATATSKKPPSNASHRIKFRCFYQRESIQIGECQQLPVVPWFSAYAFRRLHLTKRKPRSVVEGFVRFEAIVRKLLARGV